MKYGMKYSQSGFTPYGTHYDSQRHVDSHGVDSHGFNDRGAYVGTSVPNTRSSATPAKQVRVEQPKQEERKPSPTMAYALKCEQYAKVNFGHRLIDAYKHASETHGVPAEVTTPAHRGNYGTT